MPKMKKKTKKVKIKVKPQLYGASANLNNVILITEKTLGLKKEENYTGHIKVELIKLST